MCKKSFYFIYICAVFSLISGHDKNSLIPISYDLVLKAHMNNMTFEGNILIGVTTLKDEDKISLNCRGLTISSAKFKWNNLMFVQESHQLNKKNELLDFEFDNILPGNHSINISYHGKINDKPVGFFKSICQNENSTSWIAGASLGLINARSVFPSFDLQEVKVPVKVTLIINEDYNIITSKPPTITKSGGLQTVMIDYGKVHLDQIGWAFYPNDGVVRLEKIGEHRAVTCGNNWEPITYVNNLAQEISYFTGSELKNTQWVVLQDFPLPTATAYNIAFVRENFMGKYEKSFHYEASIKTSEGFAQLWFDNIVTVDSWSHKWLTKGLIKFLKYKLAEMINTDFKRDNFIIGNILPRVLEREFIPHSLTKHAHSKQNILHMYDQDLLERAGLILRMIEDKVGEDIFKKAVTALVNSTMGIGIEHPNEFWDSLGNYSMEFPEYKSVEDVMSSWINSPGYPVLSVKRDKDYITVTQESIIKNNNKDTTGYWWIPFTLTSQSIRGPRKFWLRPRGSLKIVVPEKDNWFIINEDGKGFYRVNYEITNWRNLMEAVSNKELNCKARARLIDDSLGLAESNLLSYTVGLEFTRQLGGEYNDCSQLDPWSAAMRHLIAIRTMLEDEGKEYWDSYVSDLIRDYIFGNFETVDVNLTSSEESMPSYEINNQTKMLEEFSFKKLFQINELCRNNPYCFDLHSELQDYSFGKEDMSDGLQCFGTEKISVNESEFTEKMHILRQNSRTMLGRKIMREMTCLKNITQLFRFLDLFLHESNALKRQDFAYAVSYITYSEEAANNVIDWLNNNIIKIREYISGDSTMVTNLLLPVSEKLYSKNGLMKVQLFIKKLEELELSSSDFDKHQVHRAIERIKLNIWRKSLHSKNIVLWLKNRDQISDDFSLSSSSRLLSITFQEIGLLIISMFIFFK